MATTTNYGWTTPDDTALVKDGAAAIRTLGSSIDTTTKNLNPETTLGDFAYRSSTANVKTRLALGTANQLLRVNSGATAPEWATISTGGRTLLSTTTLTGASTTISSISGDYINLQLIIRQILPASDDTNLRIRLNSDTGANRHSQRSWNTANTEISFDQTYAEIAKNIDDTVATSFIVVNFYDYANATTWKYGNSNALTVYASDTTLARVDSNHIVYNQTAAITAITLFMSSGNLSSGTAYLYGVK
jgi:hypothetical protein